MFSTTAPWTAQRTGRRRSRSDTDFQMRHGRSRAPQTRSPWSTRSWCHLFSRILVTSYFRPISQVELSMTYNCEDLLSRQTLLRYIHQNRNHNSMKINTVGKNELISLQLFWVPVRTKFVNTLYHKPWFPNCALGTSCKACTCELFLVLILQCVLDIWHECIICFNFVHRDHIFKIYDGHFFIFKGFHQLNKIQAFTFIILEILREEINWKKNIFFRALPELPKPPPPMTPIRATWSSFFGSQNSRFESQFRTKITTYTI